MDEVAQVESALHARSFPGLPEGFILPHYDGYSIANIPATIAALLGVEPTGIAPPIPAQHWADLASGVRCVVSIILDAVGYTHLRRVLTEEEALFSRWARVLR